MGPMAHGWSLALYAFMGALYLYAEQSKITVLFSSLHNHYSRVVQIKFCNIDTLYIKIKLLTVQMLTYIQK